MAIIGEIVRATMSYNYPSGSTPQNVFHWVKRTTNSDFEDFSAIQEWTSDVWAADWKELAANAVALIEVIVTIVNVLGVVQRVLGSSNPNEFGTVASTVLPPANAAYMQAATGAPKVLGKKYIPGLSEGTVEAGVVTLSAMGQLAFLAIDYITPIDVSVSGPTMDPGVPSPTTLLFQEFSGSGTFTDVVAYQRRRKPGVGI